MILIGLIGAIGLEFLKKHKKAFITILIVFCLALMTVTTTYRINPTYTENLLGYVTTPVQSFFSGLGKWVSGKIEFLRHMTELEAEIVRLRELNAELTADNRRLAAAESELEKLSELLNISSKYADLPTEGAEIIAYDPGNWQMVYILDKGYNNGFAKDMAVLSSGGLAGRLTEVFSTYSKFVPIIDSTSSVSARSARTGDTGFVKGDTHLMMEGKCRMELIDGDADIVPGDEIVTGRLSSIYPADIIIGEVLEIYNEPNGTKTAIIQPYVSFENMQTVLVVTKLFEHVMIDQ